MEPSVFFNRKNVAFYKSGHNFYAADSGFSLLEVLALGMKDLDDIGVLQGLGVMGDIALNTPAVAWLCDLLLPVYNELDFAGQKVSNLFLRMGVLSQFAALGQMEL